MLLFKINLFVSSIRIWSRKGTQGNKWRYAQIDILSYSTFKVQIEAIRGISYQGDISIDDIVVLDKECPAAKFCDFEDSSMCNWQNKPGDDFDWSRGDGDTPSIQTGPSTDHTLGTSLGKCQGIYYQSRAICLQK